MTTNMVIVLIQHPLCPVLDNGDMREFDLRPSVHKAGFPLSYSNLV